MDDYINREAAIESISGTCATCGGKGIFCGENDCSTGNHLAKLRAIPAADVKPAVFARWVFDTGDTCHCSNCGAEILSREARNNNYCYHCGADMREGPKCRNT